LKEAKDTPPATPVEPTPAPIATPAPTEPTTSVANDVVPEESNAGTIPAADTAEVPAVKSEGGENQQEAQDIPQPSIEVCHSRNEDLKEIAPGQEPTLGVDANNAEATAGVEDEQKDVTNGDVDGQSTKEESQTAAAGTGMGFEGTAPTAFPGAMGFGGDMSQMQMMMAMQNGMAPNAFGNFPMMGKLITSITDPPLIIIRNAGNEHGPDDDAKHVYEWRLWCGYGHERHERHEQHEHGRHGYGRIRWWSWRLQ